MIIGGVIRMNEEFLFPYEKVQQGAKVLIYGAGEMGQMYVRQLLITGYCEVVGMIDRNYDKYKDTLIPVHSLQNISDLLFDVVVIAVKSKSAVSEIKRIFLEAGIYEENIIYVGRRNVEKLDFEHSEGDGEKRLFKKRGNSFAFLIFFGGIGSLFFLKKFIVEIIKLIPECDIDIYGSSLENEVKYFFSDIPNFRFIYNLGSRYQKNKEQYDLALQIYGGGFFKVDLFKPENISHKYQKFIDVMSQLKEKTMNEEYSNTVPRIVLFQSRKFFRQNAYTTFAYNILDIHDKKVNIPFNDNGKEQFDKLGFKRYVTLNYGNGSSRDIKNVAKAWPIENFEKTVALFKEKHPDIEVVQLGANGAEHIFGVDYHIMGKGFDLVTQILKNAIFHLDIEGGLVHLATQLGTKCIVLFGPTPEFFYGYDENINIKVGECHDCCGVYMDSNRCARGLEKPECMYRITPEIVMEKIEDYFSEICFGKKEN